MKCDEEVLRPARSRSGFSLVEVLVALMIVSGIMLALTQLLEATRISRDTIHNIQETQLAGPAIMDLIERDLRGIMVYDREADQALRVKNRVLLGRDADRIDFVTTTDSLVLTEADRRFVRADVNEVGYALRLSPSDDEFLELYRREDFGIDDEPFDGGTYTFLHDHVKHLEIEVFDEDGPDVDGLDDWGDKDEEEVGLPKRLEIRLTLELAPRLSHEQLRIAPADKRIVTYTRIVRFSEDLLTQMEVQPVPVVPILSIAQDNAAGAGGTSNTGGGAPGGGAPGGGAPGGGAPGGGRGPGGSGGAGGGGGKGGGGGGGTRGG